jgi:hypothetical protein
MYERIVINGISYWNYPEIRLIPAEALVALVKNNIIEKKVSAFLIYLPLVGENLGNGDNVYIWIHKDGTLSRKNGGSFWDNRFSKNILEDELMLFITMNMDVIIWVEGLYPHPHEKYHPVIKKRGDIIENL